MTVTYPTMRRPALDPAGRSFIEVQFPLAKLSKESYKEHKAAAGQTLTGLGKWWGRKPLVLVRAVILGLLLPATDDPDADRDVFLALMTMDGAGLLQRWQKSIPARVVWDHSAPRDREALFDENDGRVSWKRGISAVERRRAQKRAFLAMSYDDKLGYCLRPEEIDGPSVETWAKINAHLGTTVRTLPDLVRVLGKRRWEHTPRVGDAFCGGGSVPFEATRIGCDAFASDLNPVAGLLTWGALNIVGGGERAVARVRALQERVFDAVQARVDEWAIERNEHGWIADAYLYCNEVRDPNTGWWVPMAPSWVIAPKPGVAAQLVPDPIRKRFEIEIQEGLSAAELAQCASEGTSVNGVRSPIDRDGRWLSLGQRTSTSLEQLRGPQGLRRWENEDVVPRPGDVYQERLYCIRWSDPQTGRRHYRAPNEADFQRERRVLELLRERFDRWQSQGVIPNRRIEPGEKTDEPIRTRGWTHWHHLFNPRQLLINGLFNEQLAALDPEDRQLTLPLMDRIADANSKLARWQPDQGGGIGGGKSTFDNQALNTLSNYSTRPLATLKTAFMIGIQPAAVIGDAELQLSDARSIEVENDVWITDPGYGDIILYDELSEFFLAWIGSSIVDLFPDWYVLR